MKKSKKGSKKPSSVSTAKSKASATSAEEVKMSSISTQQLLVELQNDNLFFDNLVDMIPSKLYVSSVNDDSFNPSRGGSSKYYKGQSKDNKELRRAKNKQAKRAKLDPALAESTTQLQQRLQEEQSSSSAPTATTPSGSNKKSQRNSKSTSSVLPVRPLIRQITHEENGSNNDNNGNSTTKQQQQEEDDNSNGQLSRIELLRAKIQARLAEKRGQRPSDPATISRIAARRADKKKRKQQERDGIKNKKNKKDGAKNNRKSGGTSTAEDKSGKSSSQYTFSQTNAQSDMGAANDLSRVDFGRLAGLNHTGGIVSSNYLETNKALKNMSKTKNLEKMLADAEAKKQRLRDLQQSSAEEDREKARNIQWGDAIKEASGERVKDDPTKIKKLLKRKAASKAKSAKAWKSRMEQTKAKMDERQKIRNHNLSKRKQGGAAGANLSKKRIVTDDNTNKATGAGASSANKPRLNRPGFEGRKLEFLNPIKKTAKNQ